MLMSSINGMRLGSTSPYPDNVNYVRGGQIPLLNNAPSIVVKDGKLAMVFGTPGGETIGQTEFQMLVNLVDFKLPVQQAHAWWRSGATLEPQRRECPQAAHDPPGAPEAMQSRMALLRSRIEDAERRRQSTDRQ